MQSSLFRSGQENTHQPDVSFITALLKVLLCTRLKDMAFPYEKIITAQPKSQLSNTLNSKLIRSNKTHTNIPAGSYQSTTFNNVIIIKGTAKHT